MSSRLGKRNPTEPTYLQSQKRLSVVLISSLSHFTDEIWRLEPDLAGRRDIVINWRLHVAPGVWEDVRFQRLLTDAKRVLYATMVEDDARPTSLVEYGRCLRVLIIWMYHKSYWSFSSLDARAADDYYGYVCGQFTEGDDITVTNPTIEKYVGIFYSLTNKRSDFETMPRIRIGPGVTHWLATRRSGVGDRAKAAGKIPAVPEEVFNPLMSTVLKWVDLYSDDILALQKLEVEVAATALLWRSKSYTSYINGKLVGFRFSRDGDDRWRPDLAEKETIDLFEEDCPRQTEVTPIRILRHLIADLIAACSTVVLGLVGMRISELLGLVVTPELIDGLPSCVVKRTSSDGIYDVFYIRGRLYKGERIRGKKDAEWVAGIRPVGSQHLPDAVRALSVVHKLTSQWRAIANGKLLFTYPRAQRGIPRTPAGVTFLSSQTLRGILNTFFQRWVVALPKFMGWRLTTHQFRKKFAQDIVSCDPGSPASVREHFKHLSMHVLDSAYLWTDGDLSQIVHDVAVRDAAAEILDIIDDVEPIAGRMPELIKKRSAELERIAPRSLAREDRLDRIEELVSGEGIRAWPCQFGTCIFRNETARCHFAGKGHYDLAADRPLASERSADLCVGCFNLSISYRFKGYWIGRYQENRKIWKSNRDKGNVACAMLAKRRTDQAAGILKGMKVDIGKLDLVA